MEDVENCFGVNKSPFSFKGKQNIDHVTFVDHMSFIIEYIVTADIKFFECSF